MAKSNQTKGWLDNYNDYNVSAPEGFQGDGYSNVGRNYSPAWGGQFQEGGEIPNAQKGKKVKYVESKNDPRYRVYQDSLVAYTTLDKYKNIPKNIPFKKEDEKNIRKIWAMDLEPLARDFSNPRPLTDRSNGNIERADYFTPTKYKKPQQQVIVKEKKPEYTLKEKYDYDPGFRSTKEYVKVYNTPQVQSIENNLRPAGLVEPDFELETDVDIHNRARIPKYYDVTDKVNQNFGGSETQYKYYPENGDLPDVAPSPYNTRTVTPHYQMGGNVYPVNYVPEAQTGGSFPGATGFSYARTGSIPSKGPRRNQTDKTDASAQNGKEMQHYQQGLDWKPKSISRDGSVIKDDMGYWNPDNWGKVVEIGSTDITMEGVYEPLLGISDTGDTKLMKPGKNYKFKGKKVTEYPMAKNGVNQQDQKTLQQLDQLTNFTNYNKPQPGGWLNKYN